MTLRNQKKDLRRALAKKGTYWLGDILEDEEGNQWKVMDIEYTVSSDRFNYKLKRTRSVDRENWEEEWTLTSNWDLVEMADRPKYVDEFDLEVDESPDERINELTDPANYAKRGEDQR